MTEGIYFADVDLPFHVWVRELGATGYRWVLREAIPQGSSLSDRHPLPDGAAGPQG